MASITTIKQEIRNNLDELKDNNDLGQVIEDDFRIPVQDRNLTTFPVAILGAPSIESEPLTNRDNLRTYVFEVLIVMNGDDITDSDEVESLAQTILDKFDNDPTLSGASDGAVEPATSAPEARNTKDRRIVLFTVSIRARGSRALSF